MLKRAAAAVVFLMLCSVRPSSAATPPVLDNPAFRSPITVTDGSTSVIFKQQLCFGSINHGTGTASAITFNVEYVGPDGVALGVDEFGVRGEFPTGVRLHEFCRQSPRFAPIADYEPAHGRFAPVAAIFVSARSVSYADGSTFTAATVPKSGDRVLLPAPVESAATSGGLPIFSAAREPRTPIELLAVYFCYGRATHGVCAPFVNHDARPARAVIFDLLLVDRAGNVTAIQRCEEDGTFGQGWIDSDPPPEFPLWYSFQPDQDRWFIILKRGAPLTEAGRIMLVPVEVDFKDGSSWTSPTPPELGQPAPLP